MNVQIHVYSNFGSTSSSGKIRPSIELVEEKCSFWSSVCKTFCAFFNFIRNLFKPSKPTLTLDQKFEIDNKILKKQFKLVKFQRKLLEKFIHSKKELYSAFEAECIKRKEILMMAKLKVPPANFSTPGDTWVSWHHKIIEIEHYTDLIISVFKWNPKLKALFREHFYQASELHPEAMKLLRKHCSGLLED